MINGRNLETCSVEDSSILVGITHEVRKRAKLALHLPLKLQLT